MTRYIALLRGINVGGHHRLAMADLRLLCTSLGWQHTATYKQSGNLNFVSDEKECHILEHQLHSAIREHLGMTVPVMVFALQQFTRIAASNPFAGEPDTDPSKLFVTLTTPPVVSSPDWSKIPAGAGERFVITPDAIFLCLPGGYATTKLHNGLFERLLGQPTTTRNWKTVEALIEQGNAPDRG